MPIQTLIRHLGLFTVLLASATTLHAEVLVRGINVVTATRLNATTTEYVARVRLQNKGPAVTEVRLTATSSNPDFTIVDGSIVTGPLAAFSNTETTDTISYRTTRRNRPTLAWQVLSQTNLTLSGVARTGTPLFVGATVEATVSRDLSGTAAADWGRPKIETFSGGQTDANGRFSVPVVILSPWDFVTIKITGAGGAVLGSVIGHASDLIVANGGRASVTTDAQFSRLVVSPLSTSAWALALQALGNDPPGSYDRVASEDQWRTLLQISDAWATLGRAAYIKAIIQNPGLTRPAGFTDTLDFATRDSSADTFRKSLQIEAPTLFDSGLQDLLATVNAPYDPATVPATLYAYVGDPKNGFGFTAQKYEFLPDGTGTRLVDRKIIPLTWQLDSAGRIAVQLQDVGVENFPLVPAGYPCATLGSQVRAYEFEDSYSLTRVHDAGATSLVVFTAIRGRTEYPDCPQFGPQYYDGRTFEFSAIVGVSTLANQAFPFSLGGRGFAAYVPLTDINVPPAGVSNSAGLNAIDLSADILDFNAGGTGQLRRDGTGFTWQLTVDRELDLLFANGDTARMRHLATTGGLHSVWITGQTGGTDRLLRTVLIPLDGSVIPVGANGLAVRTGLAEEQTTFSPSGGTQLDWIANSDGTGCRRTMSEIGPAGYQSALWSAANGRLDFDYYQSSIYAGSRYYEPLLYVPLRPLNDLSSGGWIVIENLRVRGNATYDPATTPGRLSFLRDLGPAVPCQ